MSDRADVAGVLHRSSQAPKRSLLPTSASPSQLTMSADTPGMHQMGHPMEGYGAYPQLQPPANPRKRKPSGELAPTSIAPANAGSTVAYSGLAGMNTNVAESVQPIQPPPAKKGRTNTPWTAAEEQRLKAMRDAGNSWSEIAKVRSSAFCV